MSTIKVSNIQNASTSSGGIAIDTSGHVTVDGIAYPSEGSLSGRNRIINGDMRIDQRNAGAAVTVNTGNAFYSVDRYFGAGTNSAGVFTLQQSTETPAGFTNSVKVTVTTSATASGTDNYRFNQAIEGFNTADLGWGSADAKAITLSFWVRSSLTGTFGGSLQNSDKSRNYPYTYTITAADTWEYKTITVAGDTAGTWVTNNGIGLLVLWCFGAADRLGVANTWSSTRYDGASGQVQLINTSGATFYITGVQLEAGSVATPFEHESYGQTLAKCQRYYETCYQQGLAPGSSTSQNNILAVCPGNINRAYGHLQFQVKKRTSATVVFYSTSGAAGNFRNASQSTDITMSAACSIGDSGISYEASSGIVAVTDKMQGLYTAEAEL